MSTLVKHPHQGPSFKAIVFDLDGTLLNTLEDIADSMNRVLRDIGRPTHPVERYRRFVGSGVFKLAERCLPAQDRHERCIRDCAQQFKDIYSRNWKVKTDLYPGIAELFERLGSLDLQMGILSNKPHAFTLESVAYFLRGWNFAKIMGQEEHRPPKPDPAGPQEMGREIGCALSEILYVGDSDVDMHTAVRSGMYPVGVLWGFRDAPELLAAGAKSLAAHPLELLDLLDSGTHRHTESHRFET